MGEIRETNTIRAPLPTQGRSFRPQYGDALDVTKVDSLYVETTEGRRVLTKEAQAIPADSVRQQAGQLTNPAYVKEKAATPDRGQQARGAPAAAASGEDAPHGPPAQLSYLDACVGEGFAEGQVALAAVPAYVPPNLPS